MGTIASLNVILRADTGAFVTDMGKGAGAVQQFSREAQKAASDANAALASAFKAYAAPQTAGQLGESELGLTAAIADKRQVMEKAALRERLQGMSAAADREYALNETIARNEKGNMQRRLMDFEEWSAKKGKITDGAINSALIRSRSAVAMFGYMTGMSFRQILMVDMALNAVGVRGNLLATAMGGAKVAIKGVTAALTAIGVVGGVAIGIVTGLGAAFYGMHRHIKRATDEFERMQKSTQGVVELNATLREMESHRGAKIVEQAPAALEIQKEIDVLAKYADTIKWVDRAESESIGRRISSLRILANQEQEAFNQKKRLDDLEMQRLAQMDADEDRRKQIHAGIVLEVEAGAPAREKAKQIADSYKDMVDSLTNDLLRLKGQDWMVKVFDLEKMGLSEEQISKIRVLYDTVEAERKRIEDASKKATEVQAKSLPVRSIQPEYYTGSTSGLAASSLGSSWVSTNTGTVEEKMYGELVKINRNLERNRLQEGLP